MTKKHYQIADLTLDTSARRLTRGGRDVDISSRAFDVLEYLIERRGTLVEKSELMERVWFDSFVEEANLAVHISAIRRLLNEKKGEPRFIKTISGRGYSFIGPVSELSDAPSYVFQGAAPDTGITIAVLPFGFNTESDDLNYLSETITNSLIDDLSKMPGLRVIAYSAVKPYRDSPHDPQELGFLIGANKLLSGRITAFRGRLEIRAELVNTADRSRIWGTNQTFENDDIFRIKDEILASIGRELKVKLTDAGSKAATSPPLNPEAQKLYFRGKFVLESRGYSFDVEPVLHQAIGLFEQAIEKEPRYALAYTGLGAAYGSLYNHVLMKRGEAHAKAMDAVGKALEIDDGLSQAYVLKGSILTMFDLRFTEALECFDEAIERNRNNADAYHWKSIIYMCQRRLDEALEMELQAIKYDPISVRFTSNITRILYFSEQYEKAIANAQETLDFEKKEPVSYNFSALCHAYLGNYERALELFDVLLEYRGTSAEILAKAIVFVMMGDEVRARRHVDEVLGSYAKEDISYFALGATYLALDEIDLALEAVEGAIERDETDRIIMKVDPRFKKLWDNPKYKEILDRNIPFI